MLNNKTKRFKVSDHLKKAYQKEDIGITHKEFQSPSRSKETFRNIKKNPVKEIVRLRKLNDFQELHNITVAKAYASLVAKLSLEVLGTQVTSWHENRIATLHSATFIKLDRMLTDMKVPAVLYIRVHLLRLKKLQSPLVIPTLATTNGYNLFADFLTRELSEKYILPADMEQAINDLSSLGDNVDPLKHLLLEYDLGVTYMEQARKYSAMLDEDLLLVLELRNLPGAYLMALEELPRLREQGLIPDEACEKLDQTKFLLHKPGIREAFMREVAARA